MDSPFGPRPKNDHSGRFLYGLFESASLLRKYAHPPTNFCYAKKLQKKINLSVDYLLK